MSISEARKRANKKYNEKTYKRYAVNTRLENAKLIDTYCINNNISYSSLFNTAVMDYINNRNSKNNDSDDSDDTQE